MTHAPFGDVEAMLVDHLDTDLSRGYVVTTTPGDLQQRVADGGFVIRVGRVGGGDAANKTVDNPRVSVQVFGNSRNAVHDRAALVRADLLNLSGVVTAHGRLDSAETEAGPTVLPWADPAIRAVQMIFRLRTRR